MGATKQKSFQGRVIAATNQSLVKLRREGKFRDDFYYRLCSDTIEVPTLRQRLEESPSELNAILSITIKRILGYDSKTLVKDIGQTIRETIPRNYPWPGNIRELEQCTRQMLLNRSYSYHHSRQTNDSVSEFTEKFMGGDFTASELLALYCSNLYSKYNTYEKVAQQTGLDRRTVKKYIELADRCTF